MTNQNERYACILDPCGLWLVWDGLRDAPAEAPGIGMVGLSEAEARRCRFLNHRSLRVVNSGERRPPLGASGEDRTQRANRFRLR